MTEENLNTPSMEETPDANQPENGGGQGGRTTAIVIIVVVLLGLIAIAALAATGNLGGDQPQEVVSFIEIEQPEEGAVVEVPQPVNVSGSAGGLFEGNLVVQALDQDGNVLAQQPTTIDSLEAGTGGEGPWSVELVVPVKPGTPGHLYAFSLSPEDGSVLASADIEVTFGEEVVIESYIEIAEPKDGAALDATKPIVVSGMGGGLFEGNVVVEARDADGNVLAQVATTVDSPEAGMGGEGPWSVELNLQVSGEVIGQIYAYSSSARDGSEVASSSVNVSFVGEQVAVESYISIENPQDSAVLDISNPVTVSGMGGGLFEGNVVVEALDAEGNVLAQVATILDSPDAGIGGEGSWTVQLTIEVAPGTQGQIRAYSPSPVDGSDMAADQAGVTYGEGDMEQSEVNLEDHLWVLASLGGEDVIEGTQITADFMDGQVAGSAGCNNYFASYESTDTTLTIGPAGSTMMFCAEPEGVMDQETQYLGALESVATYKIEDGLLKIYNEAGEEILAYNAAVTGTITYLQRIARPEDAVVEVKLSDVSRADAPATVIGEQTITNPGQVPIPFVVTYDPAVIDPRFTYAIQVRITDGAGNLMWINTSAYNVITNGNPSTIEVVVDQVS
jgi:uncharacterized lipoprotein YbaY